MLIKKYCTAVLSYKCNTSEYLSIEYIAGRGMFTPSKDWAHIEMSLLLKEKYIFCH
jgi:hypothetical protein